MISLNDLKFALEKAGCYISDSEYQGIIEEFELKYEDTIDYDDFKNIMGCKDYLGFSEVQTAQNTMLGDDNSEFKATVRRLSHRKITTRRSSVVEAIKRVRRATEIPFSVKESL